MPLQKNKNTFNFIAAIFLTISGLTIIAYPVYPQKPENDIQNQNEINLVLQVGAFIKKINATVFKEKLAAIIDKPVIMVIEEGYHKVQLTGFKNIEEIEKIIPALGLVGIKDFWIPPAKKDTAVPDYVGLQPVTIQKPLEEKVVNPLVTEDPDSLVTEEPSPETAVTYALEIGVYLKKNRALDAQSKIISKLNLPVEIVTQWNRHHVIITGFSDKTEITRYVPEIARLGFNDISVIKNFGRQP